MLCHEYPIVPSFDVQVAHHSDRKQPALPSFRPERPAVSLSRASPGDLVEPTEAEIATPLTPVIPTGTARGESIPSIAEGPCRTNRS